ncbi:hypothetical protein BJV74DRAFT_263240 [Russula compacta]|nr:hypothetical protein BJV74DRAFT_263240 [Russula compacta]
MRTIESALERFTKQRSSFIDDNASLKKSERGLLDVKKLLADRFHRYNFIQQVIQESRNSPVIDSTVESSTPDQKWVYGFVPRTIPQTGIERPKLSNSITVEEVMLEAAPRISSTNLTFSSYRTFGSVLSKINSKSQVTVQDTEAYVVGWTLSCRTPTEEKKRFMVQYGGLTHGGLRIRVRPVNETGSAHMALQSFLR